MNPSHADRVVEALVQARLLDPADRGESLRVVSGALSGATGPDAAPTAVPGEPEGHPGGTAPTAAHGAGRGLPQLVEVVAYLGGALVLAAGALFLVQSWGDLGTAGRVILLAVVALVLVLAGGVAAWVPEGAGTLREQSQDVRRRLAGALLTGAGLAVAFLVGYVVDELAGTPDPGTYWPAVAGAAAGTAVAIGGYRVAPTAVGLVGMLAGVLTTVANLVSGIDVVGSEGDLAGVTFFLVGLGWLALTESGGFGERVVARALGVATALVGAQTPIFDGTHSWLGYTLTALVAVIGVAVYLRDASWPYLAAAVLAVTLVVPEAVIDWTEGSLGAVGGVLVTGITLLLASLAGYRLRDEAAD